jgi:DNA-binding transcriptional LysR family regulator
MALTQAFRQRYPRVELSVSVAPRDAIMAGLAGFDFDVGVVADAVTDSRYFCMLYDRHPVRIMVPHSHRLAKRRFLRIADLEGEGFILRDAGSATRRAFETALLDAGVRIRPIMEINVREAVREAVARGIGLGAISENRVRTARKHTPAQAHGCNDRHRGPTSCALLSAATVRSSRRSFDSRSIRRRTADRSANGGGPPT